MTGFHRAREQLVMSFTIDDLRFATTYWYGDVDLLDLERRYGAAFMEKVYFHIAAFEIDKLASLAPDVLDLGPFAHLYTERFEALWRRVFRKVWAQWRYEHDRPDYHGPAIVGEPVSSVPPAARVERGAIEVLAFSGGGKDSLVAAKLLERAGIAYSSYSYSSSIYGAASRQHELIDGLLAWCTAARHHRQWMFDDFMDSPVLAVRDWGGIRGLTAAETPASLFGALPVMLQHGYRYLALAHEASANVGNLIWDRTGEDVNHQWGKSLEAEILLNRYLREELCTDAVYFSVLQPIHDAVIFYLLDRDRDAVAATHSCNVAKPWCMRCPKCAYVWLGYMAYLPPELVARFIPDNLFDRAPNLRAYSQMLGLEEHTPFECIGQVDETRLAFELCRKKGLGGAAMDRFVAASPPLDVAAVKARYLHVDRDLTTIPAPIAARIVPQMERAAEDASAYIDRILAG